MVKGETYLSSKIISPKVNKNVDRNNSICSCVCKTFYLGKYILNHFIIALAFTHELFGTLYFNTSEINIRNKSFST